MFLNFKMKKSPKQKIRNEEKTRFMNHQESV
eukprot:UN16436